MKNIFTPLDVKMCAAISTGNRYSTLYKVNSATKPAKREGSIVWNSL